MISVCFLSLSSASDKGWAANSKLCISVLDVAEVELIEDMGLINVQLVMSASASSEIQKFHIGNLNTNHEIIIKSDHRIWYSQNFNGYVVPPKSKIISHPKIDLQKFQEMRVLYGIKVKTEKEGLDLISEMKKFFVAAKFVIKIKRL